MADKIKIDPANVPDEAWQTACRVLDRCIRRMLQDPAIRAEYEQWKKERCAHAD